MLPLFGSVDFTGRTLLIGGVNPLGGGGGGGIHWSDGLVVIKDAGTFVTDFLLCVCS